jgi:ribose-phosphate pyrophosphokinase
MHSLKRCPEVHACCAHPVLSGPAVDRINESPITSVVCTDTIPLNEKAADCKKIKVLSISRWWGKPLSEVTPGIR